MDMNTITTITRMAGPARLSLAGLVDGSRYNPKGLRHLHKLGWLDHSMRPTAQGKHAIAIAREMRNGMEMGTYVPKRCFPVPMLNRPFLYTGTWRGQPSWSNGHILLHGDPPRNHPTQPFGLSGMFDDGLLPEHPGPTEILRPTTWVDLLCGQYCRRVLCSNGTLINARLYDIANKAAPGCRFVNGGRLEVTAIVRGGDTIGIIVPLRVEICQHVEEL